MDWRGWRRKGKDFEFLRDHVKGMKRVVGLKFDFGKMERAEGGVVVLKGGRVLG